jgi:hypothetical protein
MKTSLTFLTNANHLAVQNWFHGTAGPVKAWFREHLAVRTQAELE